jgi:thiol-disulfide isomerase/thioredoxin
MQKSLTKHLYISCLFIFSVVINGRIMLDQNDKLEMPLPLPYDGIVYSSDDLNKFIEDSINSKKQPIIIFGANWCPDCRILEGTLMLPTVKEFIKKTNKNTPNSFSEH